MMTGFLQDCMRERVAVAEEVKQLITRFNGYDIRLTVPGGYENSDEYGVNVWLNVDAYDDMGADRDAFYEELWLIADGVNETSSIPATVERNEMHSSDVKHSWTIILGTLGSDC